MGEDNGTLLFRPGSPSMTFIAWLACGVSLLLLILLLRAWRREVELRARLARAEARGAAPGDSERFQRGQYFARIGTWDWDIDTESLYWSDAIYGMFGYQVGEITPSYERFCNAVHPDDRARVRAGEVRCIETGENHDEEYRIIRPDGGVRWLRETGNIVRNAEGVAIKMIGVVRDITAEKAWASELHQMAHNDALTGLPNRLVLEQRLCVALEQARTCNGRVTLIFIDLNGFKTINDQHGHAVGDRVLAVIAARLKQLSRAADTVARIGGDEFVMVVEGGRDGEESALCERIIQALSGPIRLDAITVQVGSSLGVAVYPHHAAGMDTLLQRADLAMYDAKRSGNNQYRLGGQGEG